MNILRAISNTIVDSCAAVSTTVRAVERGAQALDNGMAVMEQSTALYRLEAENDLRVKRAQLDLDFNNILQSLPEDVRSKVEIEQPITA